MGRLYTKKQIKIIRQTKGVIYTLTTLLEIGLFLTSYELIKKRFRKDKNTESTLRSGIEITLIAVILLKNAEKLGLIDGHTWLDVLQARTKIKTRYLWDETQINTVRAWNEPKNRKNDLRIAQEMLSGVEDEQTITRDIIDKIAFKIYCSRENVHSNKTENTPIPTGFLRFKRMLRKHTKTEMAQHISVNIWDVYSYDINIHQTKMRLRAIKTIARALRGRNPY